MKFGMWNAYKNLVSDFEFFKTCCNENHSLHWPINEFVSVLPHLLSSLGEIWCKRPEHVVADSFECRDSWRREETLLFIGVNVIKFFCVLRNCDILDVNILVGEFQGYYLLGMHTCSLLNGNKILGRTFSFASHSLIDT